MVGIFLVVATGWCQESTPFGKDFPDLDNAATDGWWDREFQRAFLKLDVPRDEVIGFALYTQDHQILKLTAQFFPLKPGEERLAHLEFHESGDWVRAASSGIHELGWSAHFRVEGWDASRPVRYRIRHGEKAQFEGLIRRDPVEKDEIVVASLSCNSGATGGPRANIVENLLYHDPDLLFFAGDQTYHHTQHTAGWLEFGMQFREVLRNRPVITIPDDHDIGQGNLWGENGIQSATPAGHDGGYYYPVEYVNMVQRCQTWHLPDPYDPKPVERGISVYFTRLRVGGIDFAILEDRKFKSGPNEKIPKMGPRPDHINDPGYERSSVDVPGLELLGGRQIKFLEDWSADWSGASMKAVLSQTAFCGAVHLHGNPQNRLLADLDSNGWPQSGRNAALRVIRSALAPHLCGDQHLSVVVKHGIDDFDDGPYGFTSPAIVNTIYGRWWHPLDEKPGNAHRPESPLPWTGHYPDGLGNKITMLAYANPEDRRDERKRADGYGIARFHKPDRTIRFEAWPRFSDARQGDSGQFPGWPISIHMEDNDGRKTAGFLPELHIQGVENPVIQVEDESNGEILYTFRIQGRRVRPEVFRAGIYRISLGMDKPDRITLHHVHSTPTPSRRPPMVIELRDETQEFVD